MKLFGRSLLIAVLVLAFVVGGFLFFFIATQDFAADSRNPPPAVPSVLEENRGPLSSVSRVLSRLSMLPFLNQERPLVSVVVENHEDARMHQRGLRDALFISEYLVEGLISRFVTLYDARSLPASVGPVRSLRPYFIDALVPWTRVFFHAGGSPAALEQVQGDPTLIGINGLYLPDHFLRDHSAPEPHNLFISRERMQDLLPTRHTKVSWPPYEVGRAQSRERATTVRLNFFNERYNVLYQYDPFTQRYTRTNGGQLSEAEPINVLVLAVSINGEGEYGRLLIDIEGSGPLLLFRSGKVISGRWRKQPGEAFTFFTEDEEPLAFARGQTWMTVLNTLERVSWNGEE